VDAFITVLDKEAVNIVNSSSVNDSITISLQSGSQHDPQQDDSLTDTSMSHNDSVSPKKKIQYVNVPDCPVPLAIRHSNIDMEDCPAYKKRSKTCVVKSGDYDDVQSTVKMQRNPAYRHNTFTYV